MSRTETTAMPSKLAARKPTGMDPLYGMTDSEFYRRCGSM